MSTDLTVILIDRPGTLAAAAEALGNAGVNIEGGCGFPSGNEGILHVLVNDAVVGRRALEAAGFEVREERDVAILDPLPDKPGTLGALLRRIAEAGVNVDLIYSTADGRAVLGSDDVAALRRVTAG